MAAKGEDAAAQRRPPPSLGGSRLRSLQHGGVAPLIDHVSHRDPAPAVVARTIGVLHLRAPGDMTADADGNRGNYAILLKRLQEVIEKRPKSHGYITRGLYNWGCICPLTGDTHLAFDRSIPAIETAGAPAASAAATAASEAVFARCVFAQMFTPPPPRFSSPARSRASLLRFKPSRLRRVAARPEHTPLSDGAPNAPGWRASSLPTDSARPPSLIPTVAARDAPLGSRPWVPHLVYRRRLTPATPLDGGPATALRYTHHEDKR